MGQEMNTVKELALKLYETRKLKKEYEEKVKDCNKEIKELEETKLNDALNNLGISSVDVDDMEISRSLAFRASCFKSEHPENFSILFKTDNAGALKKHLVVDLSVCQQEDIDNLEVFLDLRDMPHVTEYSIHNATYSSILKELAESGRLTTDDIIDNNIYVQPQVKVKMK